jgi:ribonuclease P protein subunit POP4
MEELHNRSTEKRVLLTLDSKTEDTIYLKLLRADFHGAHITVIHSKINSYIGLEGIIINESLKTFKIITQQHRILTLLKPEVVMQIRTADKFYALNGNCLVYRSIDRSKIKFKNRKPEEINLQFMGELLKDSD